MRRSLVGLAGVLLAYSPLAAASSASADDSELTISHVEPAGEDVRILVSVPKGVDVDLETVRVTVGDVASEADAAPAGEDTSDQITRTTILAIDTSDSMAGTRFAAAKDAAKQFLSLVPDDVYVGVVTFNRAVETKLSRTLDRAAANQVIDDLTLARGTRLNDGVVSAVEVAGDDGQRSVLVLSDGRNTNDTPIADVEQAIKDTGVKVDAVALDQSGDDLAPLRSMAAAGGGAVIPADSEALAAAFTAEADSLARQFLVTAQVPEEVSENEANVIVSVAAGSATLRASAFSVVRGDAEGSAPGAPRAQADDAGLKVPREAMYGGLAAIGVGLLILLGSLMAMATAGGTPKTVEERIAAFGAAGTSAGGARKAETPAFNLDQAKGAAANVLSHNRGLEARIEARLEAAGSALKPSEWLLMHAAIALLVGLVGLLLGKGSLLVLVLFLAAGVLVPWLWLGHRRNRRVKAFNAGLADTLQLISGSLSAGMSLAQSIDSVVAEGHEPIAGEFRRVLVETRLGVPLEAALEGIATRIGSKDFAWVVMAIGIQREVGGNLAELLNTVSDTLRERDYLRRQVQTLSAEGKLSGYILGGLPPAMFVYLLLVRPDYIRAMYTETMGILMIMAALTLLGFGAFLISRIVKVEV